MEECPEILNKKEIFRNEFEGKLEGLSNQIHSSIKVVEDSLQQKKALNKADKDSILKALSEIQRELKANMPYMSKCFDEQLDKSVSSSKAEIEAYVQNKVLSLGLEKLEELRNAEDNTMMKLED